MKTVLLIILVIVLTIFYHCQTVSHHTQRLIQVSKFPLNMVTEEFTEIQDEDLKFIESTFLYNQHTESLFSLFNTMGLEWWPTEGTLIGVLRYGGNFAKLPSIGYIATDTDIDIMVRAESDEHWKVLCETLSKQITELPGFKTCRLTTAANQANVLDKITCYTDDYIFTSQGKVPGYDIHTDIHRYVVNEKDNYAYTNSSSTGLYYPFQYWNNKIPYRGCICDDNGKFKKAIFNSIDIPCPFQATQILQHWNGGEYSASQVAIPAGGIIKRDNVYKFVNNEKEGALPINDLDREYLEKISQKLHDRGYASFYESYRNKYTCDVIIPCIPAHIKFLEEVVNDIKNQTRQPNKVIIALSQTNPTQSKNIEQNLKKIISNVSVVSTEKIQKSWDNRDRGAVYSSADVYCFLDADDRVHPQRIEAAMEKFEKNNVKFLLCEGSSDISILNKNYNKKTFSFISGKTIYDNEIKKYGKFSIEIRHFDVDINYNTGVLFIDNKLWWSVGGQTPVSLGSTEVLKNNGIGEDIVFVRTLIKELQDKNNFIIMRNPLLVKRASSTRKETQWSKDLSIGENKTLPEVAQLIEKRTLKCLNKKLFCFWTGINKMSKDRRICFHSLKNTQLQVILINNKNLNNYILSNHPLHEGYQYLSETHKADYLRTYFMHFIGGGYTDIKYTTKSWIPYYNKLFENKDKWCIGYRELKPYFRSDIFGDWDNNKHKAIGNCMYIFKPNTPLTQEWYGNMIKKMDNILSQLKKYPSKNPQQTYSINYPYPLKWSELLGDIFIPLINKYHDHVLQGLPHADFDKQYR